MHISAHRGDSKLFGDNNIESFRHAADKGTHSVELDICITKNGHLVLNHGAVNKITGVPINDRSLLDTDVLLENVFEEFKEYTFEYILDIKDTRVYSGICRDIYEMCRKHMCLERCIIGSFSHFHLRDLADIEKATGAKIRKALITSNLHEDLFTSIIEKYKIKYVILYKFQVNQEVVNNCHTRGVQVYIYTCNTKGLYDYMDNLGCDGIITDTPGTFIQ